MKGEWWVRINLVKEIVFERDREVGESITVQDRSHQSEVKATD